MWLSILQNGKIPTFLTEDILQYIYIENAIASQCILNYTQWPQYSWYFPGFKEEDDEEEYDKEEEAKINNMAEKSSLMDMNPEELEQACSDTWRMSTPVIVKGKNEEEQDDSTCNQLGKIFQAVESLSETVNTQNSQLENRLNDLTKRLLTVESKQTSSTTTSNGNCNEKNMVDHENDELFDALAKIEELAKAKDEETVNNATQITKTGKGGGGAKQYQPTRPRVRPAVYEGTTSWEDYEAQFEMVADLNDWNSEEKAAYLAVSLVGQARTVLGDLSGEERRNFKSLTAALATRFGTENKTEMFRVNVKNRQREKDESLPELAQAIRRLTRQAYPSAAVDLRDILARDYFLDAITETDMRWKIRQARPKSLNEALGVAVELEAFMSAEKNNAKGQREPLKLQRTAPRTTKRKRRMTACARR
ncbi:hypothetical protein QZH41_009831 [Actinostola sp. cb2023]|nr:hypothetical protein QZH41_009831 [Actinostola sp. cb2023]